MKISRKSTSYVANIDDLKLFRFDNNLNNSILAYNNPCYKTPHNRIVILGNPTMSLWPDFELLVRLQMLF